MEKYLELFKKMEIGKIDLQQAIGTDLHNVECSKPQSVRCSDVVAAIQALQCGVKSVADLVDWVNVIWFTDLFVFSDRETDSMVSVFEVLETMDEENIEISNDELNRMVEALRANSEYYPI